MPYINGLIPEHGPVVTLLIGVSETRRQILRNVGFPVPTRMTVRALVDTGSAVTAVDPAVLRELDLTPVAETHILTPSTGLTPHRCEQFHVSLSLPHAELEMHLPAALVIASVFTIEEDVKALIGRDLLSHCLFVYDGQGKTFSLAF